MTKGISQLLNPTPYPETSFPILSHNIGTNNFQCWNLCIWLRNSRSLYSELERRIILEITNHQEISLWWNGYRTFSLARVAIRLVVSGNKVVNWTFMSKFTKHKRNKQESIGSPKTPQFHLSSHNIKWLQGGVVITPKTIEASIYC